MAEFRLRDGSQVVVGPIKEETIRDLIRAGAVGAEAEVARDDGPFVPIKDFEKIVPPPPWFQLEMAIGPMWTNIALIQASLLNYLSTVFRDQDYCDTLTMVVSELLENAIKHGDWARFPSALVKLRIRTDAKVGAMAEVSNPCTPDSGSVLLLMRTVSALNGSASPRQAYQRRMIEIAQ
ncbi:MAG: hypothetical protein HYZ27_01575, partial [Deltaproteobacteria bacterium]|nr:hypothetical protein [Deltaproteobacteria bacterium]